jgi:hypothetical protein
MVFAEKVYECACPVCGAATQLKSSFFSSAFYCHRVPNDGIAYPSRPCQGVHTLGELRAALRLPVGQNEDPNRIVGG